VQETKNVGGKRSGIFIYYESIPKTKRVKTKIRHNLQSKLKKFKFQNSKDKFSHAPGRKLPFPNLGVLVVGVVDSARK